MPATTNNVGTGSIPVEALTNLIFDNVDTISDTFGWDALFSCFLTRYLIVIPPLEEGVTADIDITDQNDVVLWSLNNCASSTVYQGSMNLMVDGSYKIVANLSSVATDIAIQATFYGSLKIV